MQVLEGDEASIDETYNRICRDARHRHIILLSRDVITQREFSAWSMGFRRLHSVDLNLKPGFEPLHSGELSGVAVQLPTAKSLLRDFYLSAH